MFDVVVYHLVVSVFGIYVFGIYVFGIYVFDIYMFGIFVFGIYVFGFYVFLCLMFGGCYCHDSRFISLPGQPFWFLFAIVSLRRFMCHPVCKI